MTSLDGLCAAWEAAYPDAATIDITPGDVPGMVARALDALARAESPIYDRGGQLVRPAQLAVVEDAGGIHRAPGAVMLRAVTTAWLAHELARVARWRRYDARAGEWRPVDPPQRVVETIVDAPDLGAWPPLRAVCHAPVLTADGWLLMGPGYDGPTGLLGLDVEPWSIPQSPTRDNAADALGRMWALLQYYPFVDAADRAVAVSLLITAIERPVLPAAPLHAITSPEPGTGKSLLVAAAGILATGAPAPVMDWGADAAEAAKRLDAAMLAGDPIFAIDNVDVPLEGAALCQLLSEGSRRIRPLGASLVVSVPCTAMVCTTGNNLVVRGDLVRRALVCRLDAGVERPELRAIDQDLLAEVRERRREIVADMMTILGAYCDALYPDVGLAPLGGYEGWSRIVRGAIVWAGGADPCGTMKWLRADDPHRAAMLAVYTAWHAVLGPEPITCAEILARAGEDAELRAAITLVAGADGALSARLLGTWCRYHRDRVSGGMRLVAAGIARNGVQRWQIVTG